MFPEISYQLTSSIEGLVLACSVMLISAVCGPQVWKEPLGDTFTLPAAVEPYLADTSPRDLWVPIILFAFFTAHLPSCVANVAQARREQGQTLAPTLLEWIPMVVYVVASGAWVASPYSILLRDNHLILFCLTQSFVFGRMTTKIILAHLTRQPFPYWTVLILPLVGGAIATNAPRFGLPGLSPQTELYYLYAYFLFAVVVYFRWALLVINSICSYLEINCLTIPYDKQQANKRQKQANGKAN